MGLATGVVRCGRYGVGGSGTTQLRSDRPGQYSRGRTAGVFGRTTPRPRRVAMLMTMDLTRETQRRTAPGTTWRQAAAARRREARPSERLSCAVGLALIASGLLHLVIFAVDGGPWDGPVSWRKPMTFGLSFGLTLIAIVWVTSYLRMGARTRAVLLTLFAADCVLEVGGITLQAWRGVPSHLNMETALDSTVSMALAGGGGLLVILLSAYAVVAFRRGPRGPVGMPLALRAGFGILLVGLASGAAMIARGVTLTKTGQQADAYASTAFLKPLHGVSLHAVLVLPALAWLLTRTPWSERTRLRIVQASVACYVVAVLAAGAWGAVTY
ncbi:hypothetical protein P8605_17450 [Streptomyces sp. T-3]|nr:hypothetical protein [Streptomyces sp. T-3]